MKYALAVLAVVAAIAAFFFRPPEPIGMRPLPASEEGRSDLNRVVPSAVTHRSVRMTRPPVAGVVVVYVAGEVRAPGVYKLRSTDRAVDALAKARGPLPDADLVAVNLAAPLIDGDEVAVPKIGTACGVKRSPRPRAPHRARANTHEHRSSDRRPQTLPPQKIDLNGAGEAELEAVPGIGPALAARIVAYRETNGPFASIDELADVAGITPRLQDVLEEFVFIRS